MRIFAGYDAREIDGWHVFQQSMIERCKEPMSLTALHGEQRDGTNDFTYSRFLVPWLCDFSGYALWVDGSDMLLMDDPAELLKCTKEQYGNAAWVVKHDYKTKHPRKYLGTSMEAENRDYPRKNWSSVILWDCGHYMNRCLTPHFIADQVGAFLHRFGWLPDQRIGELPIEWNWLADEYGSNEQAKLLHWTAGMPGFTNYAAAPMAEEWHRTAAKFR